MSDYEFSRGQFQHQDLIRTISISFQPFIPFTEVYSMQIQDYGGGSVSNLGTERMGYYRFAPGPTSRTNPDKTGKELPWSEKRSIYTGEGSKYPRLDKMSKYGTPRSERVLDVAPEGQAENSVLGKELSNILQPPQGYISSLSGNTLNNQLIRDMTELEVNIISQRLDEAMNSNKLKGPDDRNFDTSLSNNNSSSFQGSSQGFDLDLTDTGLSTLNKMLASEGKFGFGKDLPEDVTAMEITGQEVGSTKKMLFAGVNYEGKTIKKQKKLWVEKIEKVFQKWNAEIRAVATKNLTKLGRYGNADKAGYLREQFHWKTRGRSAYQTSGIDYEIRQLLDRFVKANMRPYPYEGPITSNSRGITIIRPVMVNGIPQVAISDIGKFTRVIPGAKNVGNSMALWAKTLNTTKTKLIDKIATQSRTVAANKSIATLERLKTVGKYTMARVRLDAHNALRLQIGGGNAALHKVSIEIAQDLTRQIKEYYKSPEKQTEFAMWYRKLMSLSNKLTRSWWKASRKLVGEKLGNPLSEEFQFGNSWKPMGSKQNNPSNYGKKKYTGVWNALNQDAWKGSDKTYGYNLSISPMMEARRKGTGDITSFQ